MRSSSLIQALLLWRCLQWCNARLYSVLFDVAPCYWKSLCNIPRAQNSWRYESVVLTNRIAGKRMNLKKKDISVWRNSCWHVLFQSVNAMCHKSAWKRHTPTRAIAGALTCWRISGGGGGKHTCICSVDFAILINWMSPFPILVVPGVPFHFHFIFDRNSCKQTVEILIRRRVLWRLIICLCPQTGTLC